MRIVAEDDRRDSNLRAVVVKYDQGIGDAAPYVSVRIETLQGATYADVRLTHQEARAIGYALLADADRLQKTIR